MSNEVHTIPPFFTESSRILILGSFPSVKSREEGFFYAHRMNRFWPILSNITGMEANTIEERKTLLKEKGIALFDVIGSCSIEGSSDAKISNVIPNDLSIIFDSADIKAIFCNGAKSYSLYRRYDESKFGKAILLPSTSPANAAYSIDRLLESWIGIAKYIK